MNTKPILTRLALVAVTLFSVVSIAQPSKEETPANESVCDGLIGQAPGLYGLCVAFCEAQSCKATYNHTSGEIMLDEKCKPSSPRILANFNKLAGDGGPTMPCVQVEATECPCWSETELDYIADGGTAGCFATSLFGPDSSAYGKIDFALTSPELSGSEGTCYYVENTPSAITRYQTITDVQFNTCRKSIEGECQSRGY